MQPYWEYFTDKIIFYLDFRVLSIIKVLTFLVFIQLSKKNKMYFDLDG